MIKYAGTTKGQVIQKLRAKEALKHLEKLREMIAKNPSPIFKMKKEDVIKEMRKTREELWNKKYAAHSR